MNILVVGGAGYIGSHMVRYLNSAGHNAIVLDNLSTGFRQSVPDNELIIGEMSDRALVRRLLTEHEIEAVMHFAACALIANRSRSLRNTTKTMSLLRLTCWKRCARQKFAR